MVMTVKVEGEARVRDGSNMTTKFYEREFEIDNVSGEGVARSVIRKALIVPELRRTLNGFKSVRTMSIVDIVEKKGKKSGAGKLEGLVAEATELGAVPDGLDQYGTEKSKEEALERSIAKAKKGKGSGKKKGSQEEDLGYID